MTPLTWWEKIVCLLYAPWRWTQCSGKLPFAHGSGYACCIRRKGHFGQHETNNGESFP